MKQDEIIKIREAFERPIHKLFYTNLMESIKPALDHLPDIVADAIPKKLIEDAYIKTYQSVGVWFAKETKAAVSKSTSAEEDLWKARLEQFAKNQAGERITEVWDYTKQKYVEMVRETLSQAVEDGFDPNAAADVLTKRVKSKFAEFTQWRALRIARTEIVSAGNIGSLEGAKVVGDQMQKIWMTYIDGETRQSHLDANNQKRELDEPFEVGGEALMTPGDPAGSAENVINCRCTIGYERKTQ